MGQSVLLLSAVVCCLLTATLAVHLPPYGHLLPGCPKCSPDACPKNSGECDGDLVTDVCGCCPQGVCGLQDGEKCYNATVNPPLPVEHRKYGMCGGDLTCQLRHDLSEKDEPEALCVCKNPQQVCGNNGKTYETICQLNQESRLSRGHLHVAQWSPCNAAPWIISAPVDSFSYLHQSLTLDCEVKGSPIPGVHWEFKGDDGTSRVLPSDDLYVAVQVRGGPEPYMVTSWLQISDLRETDVGMYSCIATNDEGVAEATAKVTIRG